MDPCTVDVKHDAEVYSYTAQNSETVHKRPVRGVQWDLERSGNNIKSENHSVRKSGLKLHWLQTYLQVDGDDEGRGCDHSEGLVIWRRLPVLSHSLQESAVRDEEDDEGREDSVKQTDEEVLVVEHWPQLTRKIKLREAQAQFIVHILHEEERDAV